MSYRSLRQDSVKRKQEKLTLNRGEEKEQQQEEEKKKNKNKREEEMKKNKKDRKKERKKKKKVTRCFTPSQPVRLYHEEEEESK